MKKTFCIPENCLGQTRNGSIAISEETKKILLEKLRTKIIEARELISLMKSPDEFPPSGDVADIACSISNSHDHRLHLQKQEDFISSRQRICQRIESGRFTGRCPITGQKIPEKRLLVALSDFSCEGKVAQKRMIEKNLYQEWLERGRYLNEEGLRFLGVKNKV